MMIRMVLGCCFIRTTVNVAVPVVGQDVEEDAMLVDADVVVVAALVLDVHWPNRRPTKITMPMLRRCRGTGTRRHT
jgi:hypothetical protein